MDFLRSSFRRRSAAEATRNLESNTICRENVDNSFCCDHVVSYNQNRTENKRDNNSASPEMPRINRSSTHIPSENRRQKMKLGFFTAFRKKINKKEDHSKRRCEAKLHSAKTDSEVMQGDHIDGNNKTGTRSKTLMYNSRSICPMPSPVMCTRNAAENSGTSTNSTKSVMQSCANSANDCANSDDCNFYQTVANSSYQGTKSENNVLLSSCDVLSNDSETVKSLEENTESSEDVTACCDPATDSLQALETDYSSKKLSVELTPKLNSLLHELSKLSRCGWYWGPISRSEAEQRLSGQCDGAFLVRDSSDDRHLLSLSFRSYGKTFHTRIEYGNGLFSFYHQHETDGLASVIDLIDHSMSCSVSGVFCYSRSRYPGSPSFPVRLTKPISRFTHVRSLQYLCRFVIRQCTRFDLIQQLPLPDKIKDYIEEGHY